MSEQQKPSLSELMKMAQKMQEGMRQAQEDLKKMKIKATAGGGGIEVTVTMNGEKQVEQVAITEQAYKEGKEIVEDLCKAAFNKACKDVDTRSQEELRKLTQTLGLPPDFKVPAGE